MGALSLILTPRQLGTGDPAGQALENIVVTPLQDGALCYVATGPAKGEWQLDKASVAVPDGVDVIAPIGGSGRWLRLASEGGAPLAGAALRSSLRFTAVEIGGNLSTTDILEIQENMINQASAHTMRPVLPNTSPEYQYRGEVSYFMRQSSAAISATVLCQVQFSRDDFATSYTMSSAITFPSSLVEPALTPDGGVGKLSRVHQKYEVNPSADIPGYVAGDAIQMRARVGTGESTYSVFSPENDGCAFAELIEVVPEA